MPSAKDCTTSTSENLSITSPGRKSASPNTTRQDEVSTVFFRYSHACCNRVRKNASSITVSSFLLKRRTRILELRLINPMPIGYPSKSCTSTRSPFSNVPMILSISLSKIHMPPDFTILPSPFFNVTTALMLILLRNLFLIIYHKYTDTYQYQCNHTFDACCLLFFSQKPCRKNHTKHRVHKPKYRHAGNRIIF